MKYVKDLWMLAKTDFVGKYATAVAAVKTAKASVKEACGQNLDFGEELQELPFDEFQFRVATGCSEYRRSNLIRGWGPPEVARHWRTTISAVMAETEWLKQWSTPEAWEAAWAAEQHNNNNNNTK